MASKVPEVNVCPAVGVNHALPPEARHSARFTEQREGIQKSKHTTERVMRKQGGLLRGRLLPRRGYSGWGHGRRCTLGDSQPPALSFRVLFRLSWMNVAVQPLAVIVVQLGALCSRLCHQGNFGLGGPAPRCSTEQPSVCNAQINVLQSWPRVPTACSGCSRLH